MTGTGRKPLDDDRDGGEPLAQRYYLDATIRRVAESATPGPWSCDLHHDHVTLDSDSGLIAKIPGHNTKTPGSQAHTDAQLIILLRNNLDALLSALARS